MKILGVDQSLTSTGIVILNNGVVDHASRFTTPKEDDTFKRVWDITQHLKTICIENKPDLVVLEGLAFGMRGNATRDLAGLQFTIATTLLFQIKMDVIIISPKSVKKIASGSGKASKQEMFDSLPQKVKNLFVDDLGFKKTKGLYDVTDAYHLAVSGMSTVSAGSRC